MVGWDYTQKAHQRLNKISHLPKNLSDNNVLLIRIDKLAAEFHSTS